MQRMSTPNLVLVTGGSGFIAGHCITALLAAGYDVRTTVRSLGKEGAVRQVLTEAGMTRGESLSFAEADLTSDDGWEQACAGVDAVLHVASPVLPGHVEDEQTVIGPARDGALRVLRAAHRAGVRRVVLTSAFHAIGFGHPHSKTVFTEADWSPLDGPGMDGYGRSKVLAERAAWDFVAGDGAGLELVTLCPVAVMGPVMGRDISGANHIVQNMLTGAMPVAPNLHIPIVDVRDVAAAHVAALGTPQAAWQRFLIASGEPAIAMRHIAATLREALGDRASKAPTRVLPDLVMRVAARFRPEFRAFTPELGLIKEPSVASAEQILGLRPRPSREAIVAAGQSMIDRGLV